MIVETFPRDVFGVIVEQLRAVTGAPALLVSRETQLVDIARLDSLRLVEAIALAEEALNLCVTSLDLDRLEVVGDIVALFTRSSNPS